MASLSTTRIPAGCANKLARPVKARSTWTPSPGTALAISAAATAPEMSPGASRATTASAVICFAHRGGGAVLGNVAALQPSDPNLVDAGGLQSGGLGQSDRRALFEDKPGLTDGVHGGRAERLLDRHRAEFHDAAVAAA